MRAAILLALMEQPTLQAMPDALERRVTELLALPEAEFMALAHAVRAQRRN
jgi:hypothetical protein